jgi:CheY-like chemotaxis protein
MSSSSQKVVIVDGNADMLALVDTVLDAGHYDVVFVESCLHAYSQIRRVQPDLVILCIGTNAFDAVQVLSMLKLDAETRSIPVVTYASSGDGDDNEDDMPEPAEPEIFAPKAAVSMN